MSGEDDVLEGSPPEGNPAHRRREEGCHREEAIRSLLQRYDGKRLAIDAVEDIALELGVSRSTMYRLIAAFRAKGTVSSVEPRTLGRRKGTLVLDAKRENLIASTIHEIYPKPERPTMTYLIGQVRARCARKGLPPPDRRTIKARVDRIDRRTVALKASATLVPGLTEIFLTRPSIPRRKVGSAAPSLMPTSRWDHGRLSGH